MIFQFEFNPTTEEIKQGCQGKLHPKAVEGIQLFNQRDYWLAHEALEEAWLEERSAVRGLYKGILQAGVMFLHIERGNFKGVMKMYKRCMVWLSPWPRMCRGVDVGHLVDNVEAVYRQTVTLGPLNIQNFDTSLFSKIK